MSELVTIELPLELAETEFSQYLIDQWGQYQPALDLSGDYYDRKSKVERIAIESVEIEPNCVIIRYIVEYSGFHPCKDLHYNDQARRTLIGTRQGRTIEFCKHQSPEQRSTCDEL
jgi:hypothetical protein